MENSKKAKKMVGGNCFRKRIKTFTKENLLMEYTMAKALSSIPMERFMKAIGLKVK